MVWKRVANLKGQPGPAGVPGLIAAITRKTVTNSVLEVSILKYEMPNSLLVGSAYRLRAAGDVSTAKNAPMLSVRVRVGTFMHTLLIPVGNGETNLAWMAEFDVQVRSLGPAGLVVVTGFGMSSGNPVVGIPGSNTALDTTILNNLEIAFTWSAAHAAASARCDTASIERIR